MVKRVSYNIKIRIPACRLKGLFIHAEANSVNSFLLTKLEWEHMRNCNCVLLHNSIRFAKRIIFAAGRIYLKALILIFMVCLMQGEASGQTKTWDGGAGTNNWADSANWNPDGIPTSTDDVSLMAANTINVNIAATTRNFSLNNSSLLLTILSGNSLTVSGNLTLSSGTLNTESSFPSVSGTVSLTGGIVGYTASSGNQTVVVQSYGSLLLPEEVPRLLLAALRCQEI